MKKIILLVLAMLSFSFFAQAQSQDKALEQLKTVRAQKGEKSQEYLSALDSVVSCESARNQFDTTLYYRQCHLDIVKEMKGDSCIDVANDLWRLGNTYRCIGNSTMANKYYLEASRVFENNEVSLEDHTYNSNYTDCLFRVVFYYLSISDKEGINQYSPLLERASLNLYGKSACLHLFTLYELAGVNWQVGNIENMAHYSEMLIENANTIDSCNYSYVDQAYRFLAYYYDINQSQQNIDITVDYLKRLDLVDGSFTNEKLDALYYLTCKVKELKEAFEYGRRAESLLINKYSMKEELFQDSVYYLVISQLAYNRYMADDFALGKVYSQICREVIEQKGLKKTKDYYRQSFILFQCVSELGEDSLAVSLAPEIEPFIFEYSDTSLEDALYFVSRMYDSYWRLRKYDDALHYCDEEFGIAKLINEEKCHDDEELAWVRALMNAQHALAKAKIYLAAGKKEEALSCIYKGKAEILNTQDLDLLFLKSELLELESCCVVDYNEALMKSDSALMICDYLIEESKAQYRLNTTVHVYSSSGHEQDSISVHNKIEFLQDKYIDFLLSHCEILFESGARAEAYHVYLKTYNLILDTKTKNYNDHYILCNNNMAVCQLRMGYNDDAFVTLKRVQEFIENTCGNDDSSYALCMSNFAEYYSNTGDISLAYRYEQTAARLLKELFGKGDARFTKKDIGRYYLTLNTLEQRDETFQMLSEPRPIDNAESLLISYCEANWNLAVYSFKLGRFDESIEYINTVMFLTDSIYGRNSFEHAELALRIGSMLIDYNNEEFEAFNCFLDAVGTFFSIGYDYHPDFIQALVGYGVYGIMLDEPIVSDYVELATKALMKYYENYLGFCTSSYREKEWTVLSNVKNTIISTRIKEDVSDNVFLYDYLLFSKSLLLSTSDEFRKAVYNTGQEELINCYNTIQAIQKAMDMQSFGISTNKRLPEPLFERKVTLEKQLIAEMKSLDYSVIDSVSYNDVASSLKPNEIAIEFVDFSHLKDGKTYYVALLAKSPWDKPVYVQLCTEDELKACLGNPNVTYSTDDLYRLLWQPLSEYIGDSCTVYFSPSGMLHTIALESIHTPDGSCLSDKYNLVRLTSTRELCKAKQAKTYKTGAVYGGLQYDVEQQRMAEVAAMNKNKIDESPVFALRGEERGNWNYLPGTLAEAEHIASIMRQANIGCSLFEGDLGSEESFKALSGGNTDIIHLATHGYYLEGEKADMNDFMKSLSPLARQKTDSVIDPLLRSGLILSGGNSAWLGKEVPEGIEDGVLTALEISTMNLSGTDMVVMSACETGLGDITSDGVFGLQRAFKMAGVQTLVMSLWKVDDNATSLMMQTFYEHLLSGMSKREAFNLAQAAVRAKYPEPYYWAGFVMLD